MWGLGCDPFNQQAFNDILNLKGRKQDKGVILVFADTEQLTPFLAYPSQANNFESNAEHPKTYLVDIKPGSIPEFITGQHSKLAVRIPNHPSTQRLLQDYGSPLVSTSLNPQGMQAAKHRFQVWRYFKTAIQAGKLKLSPGQIGIAQRPSQIIDAQTKKILRP